VKLKKRSIERDLLSFYRHRGVLIPTSADEVLSAEVVFSKEQQELPPSLASPPAIKSRKAHRHPQFWTNPSVLTLNANDPVEAITRKAREVVLRAIEQGWAGPPYDPQQLAELLRIKIVPDAAVVDARIRWNNGAFRIEFNPLRPPARTRFSLAHEIGHTLFSDCSAMVRHRGYHTGTVKDEWQLEMLCNVAAAEILMPVGSLPEPKELKPTVDAILRFRKAFQVSAEAILLRLIRLTTFSSSAFAAHFDNDVGQYRIDYIVHSPVFHEEVPVRPGTIIPNDAHARDCTGIGHTFHENESWFSGVPRPIEYLGISPYLGQILPRVLGIIKWADPLLTHSIRFEKGDATAPHRSSLPNRIIAQVVNDKAISWGPGFSQAIRKKWPQAQRDFTEWAQTHRSELKLGAVRVTGLEDGLLLANLVAQHGYGESPKPRIRYSALEHCLGQLADIAMKYQASVHMPRIGSGQAGGSWQIVDEIIRQTLCASGLDVTVYDLPGSKPNRTEQGYLFGPILHDQFV